MSTSEISITIESADGCAEVYLHNGQFKLMAAGLGRLTASVAPGLYKVRQRVGDVERSNIVDIEKGSPIVLPPMKLDELYVPFRATQHGTNLAITIPNNHPNFFEGIHLQSEAGESVSITAFSRYEVDDHHVQLESRVAPGCYTLVRSRKSGEVRRRALWVAPAQTLHAYLPAPGLTGGAIFYIQGGAKGYPKDPKFLKTEVARYAFNRERTEMADAIFREISDNPYSSTMALYAAYLYIASRALDDSRRALGLAAKMLGENCPDIVALNMTIEDVDGSQYSDSGRDNTLQQLLYSPQHSYTPMLSASWYVIASGRSTQGEDALPGSGTWLISTEPADRDRRLLDNGSFGPYTATSESGGESPPAFELGRVTHPDGTFSSLRLLNESLTKLIEADDLEEWLQYLREQEIEQPKTYSSMAKPERDLLLSLVSAQRAANADLIDRNDIVKFVTADRSASYITVFRTAASLYQQYEGRTNLQREPPLMHR